MLTNAELFLQTDSHNWHWLLAVHRPKVRIGNYKWDYKTERTTTRAAMAVAKVLGLRVTATYINGVKVQAG